MKCPKCKSSDLSSIKLEQGLPAIGCKECSGTFLSLLYYRDWAERQESESSSSEMSCEEIASLDVENTHSAMNCPKCSRIMTKYRVSSDHDNRLDLCGHCDEAWFDQGEWGLLKALGLGSKIPLVFTEQWQKKIRSQISEDQRRERFSNLLGEATVKEADEIRAWLKQQPYRQQVLQYLTFE